MVEPTPSPVRPTKRCLDDLGLKFPPLTHPLEAIEHPLIIKAQKVPADVIAGGAERIVAIKDRVWFKAKVGVHRGAVTELSRDEGQPDDIIQAGAWWWIGAAGVRQEGSSSDFYRVLIDDVRRAGKGTGSTSSAHLLPGDVDLRRLKSELVARLTVSIRRIVRRLIANAIKTGKVWDATIRGHRIWALVRARDGEAYLAISAEGFRDPRLLAIILGSVPYVAAEDWLAEPEGHLEIPTQLGQIVYSTIIPAAAQAEIVDEVSDDEMES